MQTITNTNNWHFQHYHKPYENGLKIPTFNDYELENANLTLKTTTTTTPPQTKNLLSNINEYVNKNNALMPKHFDYLAQLSCDSGEMILRLNFSEPFKGIVYPDHNRLSPCRFFGDGHHNYELRLPLRGCGTRQVSCKQDYN